MSNLKKPHFLDVFLPNLSSTRLKVPSKFLHHLGDHTLGSVSLIGPSGKEWQVKLFKYDCHLYFHEGWPTFVKDHAIQCGDTLVFGYDGNSKFSVQIFDESSCEKDEAFFANCSQRDEILGQRRERDVEDALLKLVSAKKMRGNCVPAPQESTITLPNGHNVKPENMVEPYDRMAVLASSVLTRTDNDDRIPSKVKNSGKKKQKKKNSDNNEVSSISKFIASKAAHYVTSTFPYFVRVICCSNIKRHCMKIPTHFSRLHLPNVRIRFTLTNLKGGDFWIVNSIPTFGRSTVVHSLCGGWKEFVHDNDIKIEDVCIFELVSEFAMRVRILRLGVEGFDFPLGGQSIVDNGVGLGERCLEMIDNVDQDRGVDPSKAFDEEIEPYVKQEEVSSIDLVDHISVVDPSCGSTSSIGVGDDSTSDELHIHHDEGTISYQTSSNEVDLQAKKTMDLQSSVKDDTLFFTSLFPNFTKIMMSSNVGGKFTLAIPRMFSAAHLPSQKTKVILHNLRGDSWKVVCTHDGKQPYLGGGWISFARMNNLKVGDICVFELVGEREFQVSVFKDSQKVTKCVNE